MFAEMHADVLEEFGQTGFVTRGTDAAVPVTVIVEREVAVTDGYGNIVRRVDIANFAVAQWQPQAGDRLTVGAWTKAVQTLDGDDGFITRAVMHG